MDLSKVAPEFRKEIVRGGEEYLSGQLIIATSADSRASGLAGVFTAVATALAAGVIVVLFSPDWGIPQRVSLALGGGAAAVLFIASAALCVFAIRPISFWLPGCDPEAWEDDVEAGRLLDDCIGGRAKHIQEQIVENDRAIKTNARLFKWGSILGVAAPFVGVIVWLISSVGGWAS